MTIFYRDCKGLTGMAECCAARAEYVSYEDWQDLRKENNELQASLRRANEIMNQALALNSRISAAVEAGYSKTIVVDLYYNHGLPNDLAFPHDKSMGKFPHAQKAMEKLGISYERAVPQPVADQWVFYGCTNIPDNLPRWAKISAGATSQ